VNANQAQRASQHGPSLLSILRRGNANSGKAGRPAAQRLDPHGRVAREASRYAA
jgi:hypothetical protein